MQNLLLLPKGAEGIIRLTDKQRLPMTALIRRITKELIRTIHIIYTIQFNYAGRPEAMLPRHGKHHTVKLPTGEQIIRAVSVNAIIAGGINVISTAAFQNKRICLADIILFFVSNSCISALLLQKSAPLYTLARPLPTGMDQILKIQYSAQKSAKEFVQ